MKIKCQYCGTMFNDTLTQCPHCGAPSEGVKRTSKSQPLTIEQLQKWYADRGLPPYKKTRFFIGVDYRGAKAFGIYKDEQTGNFVVYKNISSGERKIRYEGTDEAYAVNEIYMRLKQEIIQQKRTAVSRKSGASASNSASKKKKWSFPKKPVIITAVVLFVGGTILYSQWDVPSTGYYRYGDTSYYHASYDHDADNWYYFDDDTYEWEPAGDTLPTDLTDDSTARDFYYTPTWDSTTQEGDFEDPIPFTVSEYASQYESKNSGSSSSDGWDNSYDDDDYDWDSGDDWDYDTTDWDSDW